MYRIIAKFFALGSLLLLPFQNVYAAEEAPLTAVGSTVVNAAEAKALFDKKAIFLDGRKDSDWEAGRIAGAVHLEVSAKLTKESLAKHAKVTDSIVVYCNGIKCLVSSNVIAKIRPWGYTKLFYFRDGLPAWKAANYPVE
ncbi:MAG: rhodanese-like domain-containing protein [Rhodocyclaceae bacterium]|nr:rhodanese-like domain-containing protein [Rhodocyclaceae bacterium]